MSLGYVLNGDEVDNEDEVMTDSSGQTPESEISELDQSEGLGSQLQPHSHGLVRQIPTAATSQTVRGSQTIAARVEQPVSPQVRAPRPPYTKETAISVWYARTDLGLPWRGVQRWHNARFPRRRIDGLTSKYYRTLIAWGVLQIRLRANVTQNTNRHGDMAEYGVIERTSIRYAWMSEEHRNTPCLPAFRPGLRPQGHQDSVEQV